MELKLTNHAKYRFLERGIKLADIRSTIVKPNSTKNTFDDKVLARKSFGGKKLEVIYVPVSKNKALVVTAYYL